MNDGNLVPMKKTCFERRKSSLSRSFELYLNVTVLNELWFTRCAPEKKFEFILFASYRVQTDLGEESLH